MSNTVAAIRNDTPSPSEQPEATPANSSLQTIIVERRDRVRSHYLESAKELERFERSTGDRDAGSVEGVRCRR